jgi:mono/diheme cytochrome c family protein
MKISTCLRWVAALASAGLLSVPTAQAATPAELLAAYAAKAGTTPSAERGQKLFTADFGRQMGFRCASCHGPIPLGRGKDEVSEKPIEPLAPAANPARFTDKAKVENAFRMNCKDVVGRECTALEKADVMTWLLSLKP